MAIEANSPPTAFSPTAERRLVVPTPNSLVPLLCHYFLFSQIEGIPEAFPNSLAISTDWEKMSPFLVFCYQTAFPREAGNSQIPEMLWHNSMAEIQATFKAVRSRLQTAPLSPKKKD